MGLATPLPNLCCHWSLLRHCNQCSVLLFKIYFKFPPLCWISSKQYLYLQEELSPSYLHLQEPFDQAMAYQWQKVMTKGHRYNLCSHHPRYIYIFFFNLHNYVGLPKGILILQPKVNMCVSSSHELTSPRKILGQFSFWNSTCIFLGEPCLLLFPHLRGFHSQLPRGDLEWSVCPSQLEFLV